MTDPSISVTTPLKPKVGLNGAPGLSGPAHLMDGDFSPTSQKRDVGRPGYCEVGVQRAAVKA